MYMSLNVRMLTGNDIRLLSISHIHTRAYFGGVFAVDNLPDVNCRNPTFYIVNTDLSSGVGKHWVLIMIINSYSCIEWFDSLNNKPQFYHNNLLKFVTRNFRRSYVSNSIQIQSNQSNKCGEFCMYVSDMRCMGCKYTEIMQTFNETVLSENDVFVMNHLRNHILPM